MNTEKLKYFEKIETTDHREFISLQNNCILCGSELKLQHIRLLEEIAIKEEAFCKHCDMRTRNKRYTLH